MTDEELVLEAFTDFLNAVDAGIQAARHRIKAVKVGWDPSKIKWEQAEGSKGAYERSEDVNNPEFKIMLQDLASHGGRLTRDGYFYWVFENGSTVGRKKRGKSNTEARQKNSRLNGELEKVKDAFPEDQRSLLEFTLSKDFVKIVPRQYLGSDNFAKILKIVKSKNGEYVSAGKESHFKVPLQTKH